MLCFCYRLYFVDISLLVIDLVFLILSFFVRVVCWVMKIVSMFQNVLFYKRGFTKDFLEFSDEFSGR